MRVGGRGERQRGKKKRIERRGSRSAEEIVLAWWPEAVQLGGCHYLSFLSARSSVLVLRRRDRTHIDAQPDATVAPMPALTPHLRSLPSDGWCVFNHRHAFMYLLFIMLFSGLLACFSSLFTVMLQSLLCMPVDNNGTIARYPNCQQANCVMHDGNDECVHCEMKKCGFIASNIWTQKQRDKHALAQEVMQELSMEMPHFAHLPPKYLNTLSIRKQHLCLPPSAYASHFLPLGILAILFSCISPSLPGCSRAEVPGLGLEEA